MNRGIHYGDCKSKWCPGQKVFPLPPMEAAGILKLLKGKFDMPKIAQNKGVKGSQKWLQILVNQHQNLLNSLLRSRLQLSASDKIMWLSPLGEDCYAEYQDKTFLERLSLHLENCSLDKFWPRGGPVWDGLAKTSRGDIILVEAKSHVSELASSCQAGPKSLRLIQDSIAQTEVFYGVASSADWLQGYYQYANRLAHLYLLRRLNRVRAWLLFVYFVNDLEMAGPKSENEWRSAIDNVHQHLGIAQKSLRPYVIGYFPDVSELFCAV
jgi:hypothetical protein